ncbi:MAG: hypothetical protein CM1200mP8_2550 [Chloroflexota bacterium]|nr:MAG: hypothetical protein CM1200mP8_2550 [Chloroflexota bacterium]
MAVDGFIHRFDRNHFGWACCIYHEPKDANVILATIVSGSIILIISLTFALTVLNKTSKLLEDFSEGSHALASGNLEYEFPAYGNQDRKSFARSFNVMARRMRSNLRDLESERSKLSAVLETMNDGVIVADSEAKITLINPAAQQLWALVQMDIVNWRIHRMKTR